MTCLLITNDFPPIVSGISTHLYQVARLLPPDKIAVLAPRTEGGEAFDAQQAFRIFRERIPTGESRPAKVGKMLRDAWLAAKLQRRHRFAKLHCGQIVSTGLAGLICKKLYGVPFTVHVYGSETIRMGGSRLLGRLMRKVCREASEIVVNSDFTMAEYQRFGVPPEKLVKIVPGVDSDFFRPQPVHDEFVRRFKPNGEKVLLTVGRLDERKGHDLVIRALPRVRERVPGVRYVIAGSGREEGRLRSLAAELGIADLVDFAGRVPDDDLPQYYNLCDVFVLPNRVTSEHSPLGGDFEGFGIVFIEAGACGKPVIGGRSGGVAEAVAEGESGLLVDPSSAAELADAIVRVLTDPVLAGRLGACGRRRAVEQFDWRRAARQMEALLDPAPRDRGLGSAAATRIRRIAANMAPTGARRVLDAACGTGLLRRETNACPNAAWVHIDRSAELLAEVGPESVTVQGDLFDPPALPGPFDVIFLLNTLYNLGAVSRAGEALAALARLLAPGGSIIADIRSAANPLVRLRYALYRRLGRFAPTAHSLRQLKAAAAQHGLVVAQTQSVGRPLPFAYVIEFRQVRAEGKNTARQ